MRSSSRRTQSAFSSGSGTGVRISAAWLSQHGLDLAQVVGEQRRAGRDEVADQVGAAEARRDLDGARQRDDLGLRSSSRAGSAPARAGRWWRCAGRRCWRGPGSGSRRAPRSPGGSGRSRARCSSSKRAWRAARGHGEALLLDDVEADEAEVADVLLHQVRDVVVAHEQHVERHVLAVAHQLVLAAAVLQAAAGQQVERVVGEPAGLLDGDAQALLAFHVSAPATAAGGAAA